MHISLDAALQRQPLLSTVGDKLLPTFPGAAAAYSLRALNGDANNVVNVRRSGDADGTTNEREFTAEGVALELEDWVNGKLETTLPADVDTAAAAYSLRKVRNAYSGNAVQIRRASDNVEVNVAFDSNGEVSTSSAITNVDESPDAGDTTATTLGDFIVPTEIQPLLNDKMYFDRVDDYINLDSSISYTGDFTLSFSFIPYNLDNVIQPVVGNGNIDYIGIAKISGVDRIYVSTSSGSTQFVLLDSTFNSGAINDVVISRSGSTITFTINGDVQSSTLTDSTTIPVSRIGARGAGVGLFNGVITELDFGQGTVFDGTITGGDTLGTVMGSPALFTGQGFNATVVTWYDQSGNGNDATQLTTGEQPLIAENGSLLADGIEFDGSNYFELDSSISQTAAFSYFFVLSGLLETGKTLIGFSNGATPRVRLESSNLEIKTTNTELNFSTTSWDGTSSIVSFDRNDSNLVSANRNGVSFGTPSTATGNLTHDRLFKLDDANAGEFIGRCSEVIIYSSDQSANRFKIESNINNYYEIYTPAYDGFVETWYDQSGNGNDAEQTASDEQPKIVSAGSYLGYLEFDGSDDFLKTSGTLSLTQPITSFSVASTDLAADSRGVWTIAVNDTTTGEIVSFFRNDSGLATNAGATLTTAGSLSYTTGVDYLKSSIFNTTSSSIFVNGTSHATGTVGTNNPSGFLYVGRMNVGSNARILDGYMYELIIYDSDQSANRTGIESNIADEYGITLS